MSVDMILAITSLAMELALVAGWVLLWRRMNPRPGEESLDAVIRTELSRLERYLDGKVDLILARLEDGADSKVRIADLDSAPINHPSPVESVEALIAPSPYLRPHTPRRRDLSETEHLDLLLSSPDFASGVWPRMDGPFDAASGLLLGFLAGQGSAEPTVEPYPPAAREYANHWDFLLVWIPESGDDGRRFLIPRNFSRYDPAIHDHLFRVLGGGPTLDNFIRELRQCAVLQGVGPLEGLIPPDLVERKGVLVV